MNETEQRLQTAETLLSRYTQGSDRPEENRLDIVVSRDDLLSVVKVLRGTEWGYLSAITGLDLGPEEGDVEVLYHFCSGDAVVTLRVRTPRNDASVPSVCDVIPSASFLERELSEMLGVTVVGTPDPNRLFLPDDWPEGVYPLRKDFDVGLEG